MKYASEHEIDAVLAAFENATIGRDDWGHAEHLTVALYYVCHNDLETATAKLRDGIFNLLTNGFGLDLEQEMPFNETLTVFWMRTVLEFDTARPSVSILDKANELVATFDKDYPLRFYSRERSFSKYARISFFPYGTDPV